MAGFSGLIGSTIAVLTASSAIPPSNVGNALDLAAKAGDLTLLEVNGHGDERATPVREVEVNGCFAAFKTRIEPSGFRAKIVNLGEGSSFEPMTQTGRIQIRSSFDREDFVILRSENVEDITRALQKVRDDCHAAKTIF